MDKDKNNISVSTSIQIARTDFPESVLGAVITKLISIYQITRFMRPACCRFYPSCSDYCLQAIETHGLVKGMALALMRIVKCHPWHAGGIDLVSTNMRLVGGGLYPPAGRCNRPLRRNSE